MRHCLAENPASPREGEDSLEINWLFRTLLILLEIKLLFYY
jgi:hypothetical protein